MLQSRLAAIIFTVAIGGLIDTIFFTLQDEPVNSNEVILTLIVGILLGIFLHEFFKTQEKIKEREQKPSI